MAVISGTDYRAIALEYADAREKQLATKQGLFNAVYLVARLDDIEPSVDLLPRFWGSYLVNTDTALSIANLTSSARTLNNHVITRGGYASIDAYLLEQGITVPSEWAELSAAVGYIIDDTYIDA